jgi:hypothetical protein
MSPDLDDTRTVREILRDRDGAEDDDVDDLMEEFRTLLDEGVDAESALGEVFGLEPDYLLRDAEIMRIWVE